jgi:hypothetical protein
MKRLGLPTSAGALALWFLAIPCHGDPLISSWYTENGGKYARIYTSAPNRTAGISTTTWTGQTLPTYAGVHEINYSPNWVYIRNSGLGGHVMGPWNNPNLPKNQGTNPTVYRFPRTASVTATKTLTNMGAIGFFVDGVAIYNTSDGFSYSHANARDATPNGGIGPGDGIWNRDAWPNEYVSFDYALSHNPPNGQYHCHSNPLATRYFLSDNVNYDSSTKIYSENTAATVVRHSPIIGWMSDGLPLYGPYGYDGGSAGATATANASNGSITSVTVTAGGSLYQEVPLVTFSGGGGNGAAAVANVSGGVVASITVTNGGTGYSAAPTVTIGGVRRMISGYVQRNGSYTTTNLNATGRTTLPAWAALAQNRSANLTPTQYGPTTTYTSGTPPNVITYTLGHFAEDYDYLGDLGYTQGSRSNPDGAFFDLNKYSARFCVTPEFPGGTWAYFVTILTDGTPWYPYNVGRWFMGAPTGGTSTVTVMNADIPLTQYFKGAASTVETWTPTPVSVAGGNVTLTWSAVEGGTYQVSASNDFSAWSALTPSVLATSNTASTSETGAATSNSKRFYKATRASLATYDSNGY